MEVKLLHTNYRGVVFFDLDGTLLNATSKVDPDVGAAIHQLRANNYLPVINTGRSPLEIVDAREVTGIDTFISLNGSYLEHDHQPLFQGKLDRDLVREVVELSNELGDAVSFYTTDQIKASKDDENINAAYRLIHTPIPEAQPDFYLDHEILMLLLLTRTNDKYYHERFPQLTYYRNSPYSIDTVKNGISKMNGIKELVKQLQLEGLPTYGFGDGPNDLSMLNYVDHPVAMGNGLDEVKKVAEFISSSNVDGGIVKGLQHFELI